jgi:hypothetical protein
MGIQTPNGFNLDNTGKRIASKRADADQNH